MYKVKLVIAACLATAAFGAVFSAAALAASPGWMENGRTLAVGEVLNIAESTRVLKAFELGGAGVVVTCKTLKFRGGTITGLSLALASSLEFGECSANANCTVPAGINTVPILTHEVTLDGTLAAKATFIPETKTVFVTVKFEGEACPLLGVQPLTGKLTLLAPTLQDERTSQEFRAAVAEGELKVGSNPVTLTGAGDVELASRLPWSFL